MKSSYAGAVILIIVALVFLLLAFVGGPRNNAYIGIGVVFVILGFAQLRRTRRA